MVVIVWPSTKAIAQHISSVDFFINEYLLYKDAIEVTDGMYNVSMYFGVLVHQKDAFGELNQHQKQRCQQQEVLYLHGIKRFGEAK